MPPTADLEGRDLEGREEKRRDLEDQGLAAGEPGSARQDAEGNDSQAARYVGVSLATIRRWTDAGHIHCYRTPGGQRRFSRDQLDEFVTSMQNAGEVHEHPAAKVA